MYAIRLDDSGFWSRTAAGPVPANQAATFETWDEAVEAAQEAAALPPNGPWSVVEVGG